MIAAKAVDLIFGELGLRLFAGDEYGASGGVDFDGVPEGLGGCNEEEPAEHFDDVGIGVKIVIEEDDVEEGFVGYFDVFERLFESLGHLDLW